MNPLLIEIPAEIYTERLVIRMPLPGDGKVVSQAIHASLAELKAWLPFMQQPPSEEDSEVRMRESHIKCLKREDLQFLIFSKETGVLIGSTGLHRPNWELRKFEIGYWIDSRFSGKGYITEAVGGIVDFAFQTLQANRLEIRCDSKNVKSRAVAERLGFGLEGVLKKSTRSCDKQELRDVCVYAKVVE